MFAALLWTLLIVFALLAIPVRIELVADPVARPRYQFRIVWLLGIVRIDSSSTAAAQGERAPRSTTGARRARGSWSFGRIMAFVRASGGTQRMLDLLRDVLASLRPRLEFLRIEFGLDDPADTGRAYAILGPLAAWVALRYGPMLLVPSFAAPAFTLVGRASFTVVPLQTLAILLGYALSPTTLHALYVAQRST